MSTVDLIPLIFCRCASFRYVSFYGGDISTVEWRWNATACRGVPKEE